MTRFCICKSSQTGVAIVVLFVTVGFTNARILAGVCEGATGNCYVPHDNPGCNQIECCDNVCTFDPFCCEIEWDFLCATEAAEICGDCGTATAGSCTQENPTPGCHDFDCCQSVCEILPFCCNDQWESICGLVAQSICEPFCQGDIVDSGSVNTEDLLFLFANWGSAGGFTSADLDLNGIVDTVDLLILFANWGSCPIGTSCEEPGNCDIGFPGCADDPLCFCVTLFNGSGLCVQEVVCADRELCPDGDCPPGQICVILTCCGDNVCIPAEAICGNEGFAPPPPGAKTIFGIAGKN